MKKRFHLGDLDEELLKTTTQQMTAATLQAWMRVEDSVSIPAVEKSGAKSLHHFQRILESVTLSTITAGWSAAVIEEFGMENGIDIVRATMVDFAAALTRRHPNLKLQIVFSNTEAEPEL